MRKRALRLSLRIFQTQSQAGNKYCACHWRRKFCLCPCPPETQWRCSWMGDGGHLPFGWKWSYCWTLGYYRCLSKNIGETDPIYADFELTDLDKTEDNKKTVRRFLVDVLQNGEIDKFDDYVAADAIQHNQEIAQGGAAYKNYLVENQVNYDFVFKVMGQGTTSWLIRKFGLQVKTTPTLTSTASKTERLSSTGTTRKSCQTKRLNQPW